jgi:type IV fimbrial biogenesis protein FimT
MRGFSLLELLIVLSIFSILTTIAFANLTPSIAEHQTERKTRDLLKLFNLAKTTAISDSILTTICPIDDGGQCSKNWNLYPIALFLDPNNDRELKNTGALIQILPQTPNVRLDVAPNWKSYFQYDRLGTSHGSMGNVSICNTGSTLYSSRQLVISLSGRARLSVDRNYDGIAERSDGTTVQCSD